MKKTLYSFRRCPYAMRARLVLNLLDITFETIEIDLKKKPQEFLIISPKGTVPVLVLEDGTVIDESLDIVSWAIKHKPGLILKSSHDFSQWLNKFIPKLNRYKYPNRYNDVTTNAEQDCKNLLEELNTLLRNKKFIDGENISEADIAVFPFVRQFMKVNEELFSSLSIPHLHSWFEYFINNQAFVKAMAKP